MLRTVEAGLMTAPARRHGWRSQGLQEAEAGRPAALPGAQQLRGVQRLQLQPAGAAGCGRCGCRRCSCRPQLRGAQCLRAGMRALRLQAAAASRPRRPQRRLCTS
jgi:hypothetical protein